MGDHLLRKTTGNEQNLPKKKAMWATSSNAIGKGLPKLFEAHTWPPPALGTEHRAIGFNIWPTGFVLL